MTKIPRNSRFRYFLGFLLLLIIEILIANYAQDDFIRPYLGDFLVVILLYCFLMMVFRISVWSGLTIVLIFSFSVEFFQMINYVKLLQYQPPRLVMIILGSDFSAWDLMAYSLGLLSCLSIELSRKKFRARQRNPANT
ncbi:DUF2809 domain-containing protein [Christiangramia fulva]|uniref:DUF2809 domain-containing protein n=1 Tax=Christiangramia fulva TaxID=2126553 RepID=A0A2R3Z154_9FLAO|nr:DUF2809 domain-containing protein [Christiangramia fulva]AVR43984.1 DUF2809 domain-containing protein [Christiangramia fulva]